MNVKRGSGYDKKGLPYTYREQDLGAGCVQVLYPSRLSSKDETTAYEKGDQAQSTILHTKGGLMENETTVNVVRGRITFDSDYVIVIQKDRHRKISLTLPDYDRLTFSGLFNANPKGEEK